MLSVLTLPVGQLSTNCYIVSDGKTSKSLIVDPGDDPDYITRVISDKKLNPTLIVATHGHFDHIMAVAQLKWNLDIPFKINKKDKFLVENLQSSAKHFLGIEVSAPPNEDGYLKEGDTIEIGGEKLKVVETPGHTPGSICLYNQKEKILFCGDLLFSQKGVGRSDFSYSNSVLIQKSIKKILTLPYDTKVYPGHGESFRIADW